MTPSRVMIAAEQQRCEDIISEEWQRAVIEFKECHTPSNPTELVMARVLQRIRRVE